MTCTFEGILRVEMPEQLASLLENGVGPAKAFGCGLLLVRRLG
ncbi:MAG: type I-E CRISPR-associated protein Cas6/Cse3/CasE [Thiobacillus sp.]